VQRSSEPLFAHTTLAGDEDGRIEGRDFVGQRQDLTHGRTCRHRVVRLAGIGLVHWQRRGEDLQADGECAKQFGVVIMAHVHLTGSMEERVEGII
jgi:hypothetical protein